MFISQNREAVLGMPKELYTFFFVNSVKRKGKRLLNRISRSLIQHLKTSIALEELIANNC